MVPHNISNAVYSAYNTGKDFVNSSGKALGMLGGVVGLVDLLSTACSGREAVPLEVATSTPPSKPKATVQAEDWINPGTGELTERGKYELASIMYLRSLTRMCGYEEEFKQRAIDEGYPTIAEDLDIVCPLPDHFYGK